MLADEAVAALLTNVPVVFPLLAVLKVPELATLAVILVSVAELVGVDAVGTTLLKADPVFIYRRLLTICAVEENCKKKIADKNITDLKTYAEIFERLYFLIINRVLTDSPMRLVF